jgi:hypothetical protein
MTRRSTGIVHATRLTMNLSIRENGDYLVFGEKKGQGARCALPFSFRY